MSNNFLEIAQEDLADEFYDDVEKARDWLIQRNVVTPGLSDTELCDIFVEYSIGEMI